MSPTLKPVLYELALDSWAIWATFWPFLAQFGKAFQILWPSQIELFTRLILHRYKSFDCKGYLDINEKFNLFSPFILHPLSQLSTWGFPWSMNYRKGSNEHSLARSLKYQPCKNQNLGGNFLAVKSCASSVGWGLEREHNGLKSFIFLSWKTEVNKFLNAPSEMIALNWKMHSVAVNTLCLYMNFDGRKTSHFLFILPGILDS